MDLKKSMKQDKKEDFYSLLRDGHINDGDYEHAKKV